jgi:hypothetical protein
MPHKRYHPGFVRRETANIYDKPLAERTTGVTNREALSFSIGALVARSLVGGATKKSLGMDAYNLVSAFFKKKKPGKEKKPHTATVTHPGTEIPKSAVQKKSRERIQKSADETQRQGYYTEFGKILKREGLEDTKQSPKVEEVLRKKAKREWKRAKQTAGKRRGGGFDEDPIPQPQTTWGKIASMVFSPRSFPGGIANLYHTASSFSSSEKLGGKKPSPVWRNPR